MERVRRENILLRLSSQTMHAWHDRVLRKALTRKRGGARESERGARGGAGDARSDACRNTPARPPEFDVRECRHRPVCRLLVGLVLGVAALAILAFVTFATGVTAPSVALYPAVLAATLAGGWQSGLASLLAGVALVFGALEFGLVALAPGADTAWHRLATSAVGGGVIIAIAEWFARGLARPGGAASRHARVDAALRLASIVDTTADAVIALDVDGRITCWNPAAERLFGYTAQEAIGRDGDLLIGPGARLTEGETARGAFDIAMSGELFQRDTQRVARDGTVIDVSVTATQIRSPDGTVLGVSAIMRDIRERRRREAELRRSREELNRAQAIARIGSWSVDLHGKELLWSEENHRLFGIPPGEPMTLQTFLDTVHPDDLAMVEQRWQEALAGAPYDIEHRILVRGETRWVRERAELVFDDAGSLIGGFGTTEDITEKKRIDAALRDSEQRLRFALKSARAAAWQWNVGDEMLIWSPESNLLHGRDPALGPASLDEWITRLHPDDRAAARKAAADAIGRRTPDYQSEYRVVMPSGEVRWLAARGMVEFADDGRPLLLSGIIIDITERKEAEAALARSEERFRLLVEQHVDGIFVSDGEGRYLDVNPAGCQMLGYTRDEIVARRIADVIGPEEIARIPGEIERLAAGCVQQGEWRFVRKDGSSFVGEVVSRMLPDGRLQAILRDVTDRKRAADALAASEARLAALVKSAMDGIVSVDADERICLFNPAAEKLFGLSAKDALGQPLDTLIPLRHRAKHESGMRWLARGSREGGRIGETVGLRANGEEFPIELSIAHADVDGQPIFTAVVRDVTDRKRAEAAVRDSEERLRLSTEAGNIGTFLVDLPSGRISYSPQMAALSGFDVPAPTIDAVLSRMHRDDVASVRRHYAAALDSAGDGTLQIESRFVRPGGEVRWMTWKGRVEFAETPAGRTPLRLFGACVDTTERKQAMEAMASAKVELEARVAERTRALQEEMQRRQTAQSELAQSQRLEALGRLAGGLTHDFNNTLAAISAHLELAEPRVTDALAHDCIERALDAVEIGASLNRRLLTFASRRKTPTQVIRTGERIEILSDLLKRTIGSEIVLETDVSADLWPTLLDPGDLESAVLNLAINAHDAMHDSGGRLTIEARNVTLGLPPLVASDGDGACGDYVRITVRDTGRGMTPEVRERAGEPFFTTRGSGKGTGLGLSSVNEFVRSAGGFMTIESAVGVGTTVSLFLRRAAREPEPSPGRSAARIGLPLGDGQIVLLVDDDDRVLEATNALLEGLGYAVVTARSGAEARALLDGGEKPDIVLSDIVMPGGVSGYDLAASILSQQNGPRVVLASGFHNENPAAHGPAAGVKVLRKPYSRAELAEALHAALHG